MGLKQKTITDEHSLLEKELKYQEICYDLAKEYWGRGLMPEGAEAVIQYCFESLGVEMVTCGHFKENYQSKRVIEKLGFTYLRDFIYKKEELEKKVILYYRLQK